MPKEEVILFLIAVILTSSRISNCSTKKLRIVGGKNAAIDSAPFIVSFQYNGTHYCAGSILNKNWVVTAAHCLSSKAQVFATTLVAGSINVDFTSTTTQRCSIDNYVVNDLYLGGTSPYDIGLVYTANRFIFSNEVAAIALPPNSFAATGDALVYGWGSISLTTIAVYPKLLQVSAVPIITQSLCETALGSQGANIHVTNICTGPLAGGVSICVSDSGGPLVQSVNGENVLIGIVSWGKVPCGQRNSPSVYVKISALLSWISNNASI